MPFLVGVTHDDDAATARRLADKLWRLRVLDGLDTKGLEFDAVLVGPTRVCGVDAVLGEEYGGVPEEASCPLKRKERKRTKPWCLHFIGINFRCIQNSQN